MRGNGGNIFVVVGGASGGGNKIIKDHTCLGGFEEAAPLCSATVLGVGNKEIYFTLF